MNKDILKMIYKARKKIIKKSKGKKGVLGIIKCPVCKIKDNLHYTVRENGDVHGYCKTLKCVNWME